MLLKQALYDARNAVIVASKHNHLSSGFDVQPWHVTKKGKFSLIINLDSIILIFFPSILKLQYADALGLDKYVLIMEVS